jgi:hypothetical protein
MHLTFADQHHIERQPGRFRPSAAGVVRSRRKGPQSHMRPGGYCVPAALQILPPSAATESHVLHNLTPGNRLATSQLTEGFMSVNRLVRRAG